MKLSAVYNFFDGGELLLESVRSIRPYVDHLSIVFQRVSNYGNPQSPRSIEALDTLSVEGLVDVFEHYEPDLSLGGSANEFHKRHRGLELAKAADCETFLFLDADEFYDGPSFVAARRAFETSNWRSSSVQFMNYYGGPTLRMARPVGVVPFICRVTESHTFAAEHPYLVDPTRSVRSSFSTHHLYPAADIVMHHMTGVRLDLEEKLRNSSLNDDVEVIRYWRERYEALPQLRPGLNSTVSGESYEIEEVPDVFGLGGIFDSRSREALPAEHSP